MGDVRGRQGKGRGGGNGRPQLGISYQSQERILLSASHTLNSLEHRRTFLSVTFTHDQVRV